MTCQESRWTASVGDAHEVQAMWGGGQSRRSPIPRIKDILHSLGCSLALAHFNQRADDRADHLFEEPVRENFDADQGVLLDQF